MEMSQRILYWYQILLKMLIFWQNGKISLYWSKIWQAKQNNFELKILKLLENHVKTQLLEHFFQIFEYGNSFENFDQKVIKHDFLPKNYLFWHFQHFLSKFSKILPKSEIWKKKKKKKKLFLEKWLNMIFKQF